jgi:hypothetical protein
MVGVGKVSRFPRGILQPRRYLCTHPHQRRCTICSGWPVPCQARPPPWGEWGKCPHLQEGCNSQGVTYVLTLIREGVPYVAAGQYVCLNKRLDCGLQHRETTEI